MRRRDFRNSPLKKGEKGGCRVISWKKEPRNNPLSPLY
jgi:hypothetical protein